jgi:hypothetical protein
MTAPCREQKTCRRECEINTLALCVADQVRRQLAEMTRVFVWAREDVANAADARRFAL